MAEFSSPCLTEALRLADMGLYVFPSTDKKASYLSAKHAPGGLNWGMSNDPEQVRKNFSNPRWRLKCGVGLPTGWINKVFVVETDTIKGHGVDGAKALRALEKKYGKLPKTKTAKSPSGSVHRYYRHPGERFKLKSMSIAAGVDVKADGGMVIAPPSVRGNGKYVWMDTRDIAEAPSWLIDMIVEKEAPKGNGHDTDAATELDDDAKSEGCTIIGMYLANNDDEWDTWNTNGLKIFNTVPDERGFEAFDLYSQRSNKYDADATRKKWDAFSRSPPTHLSHGSFIYLVRQAEAEDIINKPTEEWIIKPKAAKTNGAAPASDKPPPADLWDNFYSPPLPLGLLPKTIEAYALAYGSQIGCDPSGLAMGALVSCAAVIPDRIKVRALKHSTWAQPARLWVALVGAASVKKTPIYAEAMAPITEIDRRLVQEYMKRKAEYEKLDASEKKTTSPPTCQRLKIEDITIEKAQEIFADNPDGLMMARNELSGWFGSMDKYSSGKGSHTDRGFWLATYDGHGHTFDRVKRGTTYVENLGLSLLGGIQPSVIRKITDLGEDDGLIERLNPIVCREGGVSRDAPIPKEALAYKKLIFDLYELRRQYNTDDIINFTDEARVVRERVEREYHALQLLFQQSNAMFASHLGKYHGMFVRMCLLWHLIEHSDDAWLTDIEVDTAERVAKFMREFLMRHAAAFYYGVLDIGDAQERMRAVGSYILAHKPTSVSNRDIQRSTNSTKNLKRKEVEELFEQMSALGWVERFTPAFAKAGDPPHWKVNPAVHTFSERAEQEKIRREKLRAHLLELRSNGRSGTEQEHGYA